MTCIYCGLPAHLATTDCQTELRAALKRKRLVIEQLCAACKEAAETITKNELWGGSAYISSATLVQIQHALDSAKGE